MLLDRIKAQAIEMREADPIPNPGNIAKPNPHSDDKVRLYGIYRPYNGGIDLVKYFML